MVHLLTALGYLLPALALLAVLACRRYPGERALVAAIEERRRGSLMRSVRIGAPRVRPRALLPRGGRLIASSLAVRPPPALPALH
ncbi:MAG TPA: hypothetical protein VN672_06670 [Solirubrobacteraceae bacterium]|nr:hypothetical protein [Solirubrobacteraceae bacterium]